MTNYGIFSGLLKPSPLIVASAPSRPVIERITSATDSDMFSGTSSHAVPSGVDLLLVFFQGWPVGNDDGGDSTPADAIDTVTWSGSACTLLTQSVSSGSQTWQNGQQTVWYKESPASASAILAWSGGIVLGDGGCIHIVNLKNVDLTVGTSGIRDYFTYGSSTDNASITCSLTTTAIDLIVVQSSQQGNTTLTGQTYSGTAPNHISSSAISNNGDAAFLSSAQPTAAGQTVAFKGAVTTNFPGMNSLSIAGK